MLEHRVTGLCQQAGQRLGIGGVSGLDPLCLRQLQLGEKHLLQLLGRAKVELVAGSSERALLGRLHLAAQAGRHLREVLNIGRDAGAFHLRQHADQRQLDLREQLRGAAPGQIGIERVRQLSGGERALRERLGGLGLGRHVERQLPGDRRLAAEFAPGVPQRQVGQVE